MSDTLFPFLARSVSPWHAAQALAERLAGAGYTELLEQDPWRLKAGSGFFVRRGGALVAFVPGPSADAGWNIAAAHTDSPGWRLKLTQQKPQAGGVVRIGTEVYGSPIHSTWFDRPLAIAGRVFVKAPSGPREVLVRTEPLGVFPNLAIHYNREVNKGQAYDLSEHLNLLAALEAPDVQTALARRLGFDVSDWLSADLFAVEPSAPAALGTEGLFLSPRIDNLTGCHSVVEGLLASSGGGRSRLVVCFDQEEIGSSTWTGADSSWLGDLLQRVHGLLGGTPEDWFRAKARSFVLSVDSTHGLHPNWAGQHDGTGPLLGGGIGLKSSARFSYSTTAASEARVREAAARAGVAVQSYIMKSTLTPGSTVGPITTSWTGIAGADVGIPIWAMHSANETAHQRDQQAMIQLITALLNE